jgi:beta-glucuronidase
MLLFLAITQGICQPMLIQNIYGRTHTSLNGRWNYIIDPYEMGYYNYRRTPYDQSESGKGGFYDDNKQKDKGELIEYDFDLSPNMKIPGDWNSPGGQTGILRGYSLVQAKV